MFVLIDLKLGCFDDGLMLNGFCFVMDVGRVIFFFFVFCSFIIVCFYCDNGFFVVFFEEDFVGVIYIDLFFRTLLCRMSEWFYILIVVICVVECLWCLDGWGVLCKCFCLDRGFLVIFLCGLF